MFKVEVVSKVIIDPIPEATIYSVLEEAILKENPHLEIVDISFERKLNPNRIEAIVDAQVAGTIVAPPPSREEEKEEVVAAVFAEPKEEEDTEAKPKVISVFK